MQRSRNRRTTLGGPVALAFALVASGCGGGDGGDGASGLPAPVPAAPCTSRPGDGAPSVSDLPLITPAGGSASTSCRLRDLPRLLPGVEVRAFSSYDREDGNDDGFAGTYSAFASDGDSARDGFTIADAAGPGRLTTLWFTSAVDGNGPLSLGLVRFFFDDEREPRIAIDADALFRGDTPPFRKPLVAGNQESSGGFASWVPLTFRRRLRITTERRAGFMFAEMALFPSDWDVPSWQPGDEDSDLVALFSATDFSTAPLEPVPLDVTFEGAGEIDVLRFEPDASPSPDELRAARVRATFDESEVPQIDVPLDTFFGSGLGEAHVRALHWTMVPGRYESRLAMPFFRRARLEVTGIAGRLAVHRRPSRFAEGEAGYLEARYVPVAPTAPGVDHTYVDTDGTGMVVGTVLVVEPGDPARKQWWEGDLRSWSDGLGTPSVHGTGHEDDHLGGWSNEFLDRPYSLPMQGCPKSVMLDRSGQYNANASMYRLWAGLPFAAHVEHVTEHGPSNQRQASYGSVTFLYRLPEPRLERSDGFDVGSGEEAAAHGYAVEDARTRGVNAKLEDRLLSSIEGVVHEASGSISFELGVWPDNEGVKLRRRFDQVGTLERARVEVDGVRVGSILTTDAPRARRWQERDFFLPASATAGKARIHVRVLPEGGSVTASRWEAWSVRARAAP